MKQCNNILITDSSEAFCKELRDRLLETGEYGAIHCATDGEAAAQLMVRLQPEIMIVDRALPHLEEIVLLCSAAAQAQRPAIILTSAFFTDFTVEKAASLGAQYFIFKPCDPMMVVERVHEIAIRLNKEGLMGEQKLVMVTELMKEIGITPNLKGYHYLREAILIAIDDIEVIGAMTKVLYPKVAMRFQTTPPRVERAIRHAITVAWNQGDAKVQRSIFGHTIASRKGKPTNSEFIALVADKLHLEMKKNGWFFFT